MLASVDAAASRVRGGYEALLTEQKEVAVVLKSAAVKRALETDPDLKLQIEAATQVFKQDQQRAKEAEQTLQTLQQAKDELGALAKLLG
jgi:seryl-tRNA(Sec) selenium transferase